MLLQFTADNFMSFHQATTFSMVAAEDPCHPDHVMVKQQGKRTSALRAAALYGANGAGKSNLVRALDQARRMVVEGARSGQPLTFRPFRLDPGSAAHPTAFEFILWHGDALYSYGFRFDAQRVREEWLLATVRSRETTFFQRVTAETNETEVEFGPSFTGRSAKQRQFLEFVARGTRPNQLFLTEAAERNVEAAAPVMEWFRDALIVIPADSYSAQLVRMTHTDPKFADYLSMLLREVDTGIEGVETEAAVFEFDRHLPGLPESERPSLLRKIADLPQNIGLNLTRLGAGDSSLVIGSESGDPVVVSLRTLHPTLAGGVERFSLDDESDGTQRLIHLAPALFAVITGPRVLIIDELDRRLHPLLSRTFVETFLRLTAGRRSQMVFTTHDTHLLDLDLLRRDEIWFAEKDREGASHLTSLAEFKIRPDLKVDKGYLNGRFGAIPLIGSRLDRLAADGEA